MSDEAQSSNTTGKQPVPPQLIGKGFKKGDPRINRKGRPKSFDQLRALAQMIANEPGATDPDGKQHTNAEMALRKLLKEETVKFLEISYGKVPQAVDVTSGGDKITSTSSPDEIAQKVAALMAIAEARKSGNG